MALVHDRIGAVLMYDAPDDSTGAQVLGVGLGSDESEPQVRELIAVNKLRLLNRGRAIWGGRHGVDSNNGTWNYLKAGDAATTNFAGALPDYPNAPFGALVIVLLDGIATPGIVTSQPGAPLRVAAPLIVSNGRVLWGAEHSTDSIAALMTDAL